KIAVSPLARGAVDLDDSLADNLRRVAFARDVRVQDLVVAVLDRPRHREMLDEVRSTGARILNLEEGDIAAALMTATDGTGEDAGRAYGLAELAPEDVTVAFTGISGGPLLKPVWFGGNWIETSSFVMSSRRATVRRITTRHHRVGEPV